jgi:hypothetical protein
LIRAIKLSNLTRKEQIGVIILIWRKCTKESTRTFALLALPVSVQKLNGEVVETEQQAFGCKTKYELIHPDHLIFVETIGSNTSQTKMFRLEDKPI